MTKRHLVALFAACALAPGRAGAAPASDAPADEAAAPDGPAPSAAECEKANAGLANKPDGDTLFKAARCQGDHYDYLQAVELLARARNNVRLTPDERKRAEGLERHYARLIVTTPVVLDPADAEISIDGKKVEAKARPGGRPLVRAGSERGASKAPAAAFDLQLNAGRHTIEVTRRGFAPLPPVDVTFSPERPSGWCPNALTPAGACALKLRPLEAEVRVTSTEGEASIVLNGKPRGQVPPGDNAARSLNLSPGRYDLKVDKGGFETYTTKFSVTPDQSRYEINARLNPIPFYRKPIYYVPAAGALLAAVTVLAILSYNQPAFDGGSTGVVIDPSKK